MLFLYSCDSKKEQRKAFLEHVNVLQAELDSTESLLLSNEIDTISGLKLSISSVVLRLKNNLILTEVDSVLSRKIDSYKIIGKNIDYIQEQFLVAKNHILKEKESLSALKYDLEKGLGEFDKYKEYVDFEKGKIDTIKILALDYINQKNQNLEGFAAIHNELFNLSISVLKPE